jgi:hypothetical protein
LITDIDIEPGRQKEFVISHLVEEDVPLGTYVYHGFIYLVPSSPVCCLSTSSFEFTIYFDDYEQR